MRQLVSVTKDIPALFKGKLRNFKLIILKRYFIDAGWV